MAIYKSSTRKTTTVARPATNTRKTTVARPATNTRTTTVARPATNTRKSRCGGCGGARKTTTTKRK